LASRKSIKPPSTSSPNAQHSKPPGIGSYSYGKKAERESAEHELARAARKELIEAVRAWVMSRGTRTLDSQELVLRNRFITYDKLKKITGRYKIEKP